MTLLEKEREQIARQNKRAKNVKMLTDKLEDAKLLYSIVDGKSFQQQQERMTIGNEIQRIEAFISSELEDAAPEIDKNEINRVFG